MPTLIKAPLHCRHPQDLKSNHCDSKLGLHQPTVLQPIATQSLDKMAACKVYAMTYMYSYFNPISVTNMQALK